MQFPALPSQFVCRLVALHIEVGRHPPDLQLSPPHPSQQVNLLPQISMPDLPRGPREPQVLFRGTERGGGG